MKSLAPGTRVDIAVRFAPVHWLEPMRSGRERIADVIVVTRDGGDRRELQGAAMIECIGVDGEQRTYPVERADRHRPGDDCGDVSVQHRDAGGGRMPFGALLQPLLKLLERHHGGRCGRSSAPAPAHAATFAVRSRAAFQFQARSSCSWWLLVCPETMRSSTSAR
jgi:hypothetical protein